MSEYINITVSGTEHITVEKGTKTEVIAKKYQHLFKSPIMVGKIGNVLCELCSELKNDCNLTFLDMSSTIGMRIYGRSAALLLVYATKEVLGHDANVLIEHSIDKNFYCEVRLDGFKLTNESLAKIEEKMHELVDADIPIEKHTFSLNEGVQILNELGMKDKVKVFKYRRVSNINLYKINWFYDYFYGYMLPSTSYIKLFKLIIQDGGLVLVLPKVQKPLELTELKPLNKISQVFMESSRWGRILNVDNVGALNDTICSGKSGRLIRVAEALHEKKIAEIGDMIDKHSNRLKVILIAGPSSSGKTTFAHRLCIQLRVNGIRPHVISLDNYFNNRDMVPLDENGKPDFESINHIDIKQFNEDLNRLLNNEAVNMPIFNFLTGMREYKDNWLKMSEDNVLVIEGIHGLNERLTETIPRETKFKIFVSAITQLNVDDHNRIPTTDTRLLRRIVRDYRFRNYSALQTLSIWPSVLRGEARNIFPFQEDADAIFNSALIYELCILKILAEPLLFQIDSSSEHFTEAKRLIKFLDSILGLYSDDVPSTSIMREFIGGSCFE